MLRTLDICGNEIRADGCKMLARALLKGNTALQTLDVSDNEIGPAGCTALAMALGGNNTLQTLNLRCNEVGNEGCKALANLLLENNSKIALQVLDLSHNRISDDGFVALVRALEENGTLRRLEMNDNGFGDGGCAMFATVLETNYALSEVFLHNNAISPQGATVLARALEANTTVATIVLEDVCSEMRDLRPLISIRHLNNASLVRAGFGTLVSDGWARENMAVAERAASALGSGLDAALVALAEFSDERERALLRLRAWVTANGAATFEGSPSDALGTLRLCAQALDGSQDPTAARIDHVLFLLAWLFVSPHRQRQSGSFFQRPSELSWAPSVGRGEYALDAHGDAASCRRVTCGCDCPMTSSS